jgi:hypothetical protein
VSTTVQPVRPVSMVSDVSVLPQRGRIVLVVLHDGRQIEGEVHTMTSRYEVGGVAFYPWEIEEIEDII